MSRADLPYEEKHPLLLPSQHFVTSAILLHFHEQCIHQGRMLTVAALRHAGFYIHNQKNTVGKFLRRCVICRKLRGFPESQIMADLPGDRIEKVPPFTRTGVDVFGPYLVYDGRTTRRSSASKKVWVVLFTCLYSRAIHVDLLSALDSSTFHLALRRFSAIRGSCELFRSDRGTNFVGLENQISGASLESLVQQSDNCGAKWLFLPAGASHFAGVWERKIGSVKRVLDASMQLCGSSPLSRDEFATLLQEAASIVNSSPLGDTSSDPNDPFPVSPAALLTLKESLAPPSMKFTEDDIKEYGRRV